MWTRKDGKQVWLEPHFYPLKLKLSLAFRWAIASPLTVLCGLVTSEEFFLLKALTIWRTLLWKRLRQARAHLEISELPCERRCGSLSFHQKSKFLLGEHVWMASQLCWIWEEGELTLMAYAPFVEKKWKAPSMHYSCVEWSERYGGTGKPTQWI